ncbi:MAG: stage II sporulation protein R [Clostridia bacterium]
MKKVFIFLISSICAVMCVISYASETNERLSRDIVRLHIIANSNSEEDQALKLRIRDQLLSSTSVSDTKADIPNLLEEYKKIAKEEIENSGYSYDVHAEYGKFDFPTKNYGNLTYPAGKYDAVRIVIGEGKGENWWCVLFPPLCYVKGSVDSSEAEEELQEMLSPDDYELITSGKEGRLPVKIKFKLIEWINSHR